MSLCLQQDEKQARLQATKKRRMIERLGVAAAPDMRITRATHRQIHCEFKVTAREHRGAETSDQDQGTSDHKRALFVHVKCDKDRKTISFTQKVSKKTHIPWASQDLIFRAYPLRRLQLAIPL